MHRSHWSALREANLVVGKECGFRGLFQMPEDCADSRPARFAAGQRYASRSATGRLFRPGDRLGGPAPARPGHPSADLLRRSASAACMVVMLTGTFIGMVLAVQAYGAYRPDGPANLDGLLYQYLGVKELGPVLAATMLAGRVGSAMAAELGTMRVTEQIDALWPASASIPCITSSCRDSSPAYC